MAAQSWQVCARMHSHVAIDVRRNERGAGNAMRGHLACANSTSLRRPPGTTHFPLVEMQLQLCLRRSTSGKLVRYWWEKANLMRGTMCDSLVTDECLSMLEKRRAAPQYRPPAAAVDATSSNRVSMTLLEACDESYKQQMLSTGLRYALCNSADPHPGSGLQLHLLRIGCDQLHILKQILVHLNIFRPMPTLCFTSIRHSLDNLTAHSQQDLKLAPQAPSRITFVCLFLQFLVAALEEVYGVSMPFDLPIVVIIFVGIVILLDMVKENMGVRYANAGWIAIAAVPPIVWLIRFLSRRIKASFSRTSVVRIQVGLQ